MLSSPAARKTREPATTTEEGPEMTADGNQSRQRADFALHGATRPYPAGDPAEPPALAAGIASSNYSLELIAYLINRI
jgi:hypothetical protein